MAGTSRKRAGAAPALPLWLRRPGWASVLVALLAAALAIALWAARAQQPLLERIDRLSLDAQMQWRGRLAPAPAPALTSDGGPGVLLLCIDDASLQRLGGFVPDRRALAQAISALHAADAKLIALDLLLLDPARPDPSADVALAEAMRAAGNVLIPFALVAEPGPGAGSSSAPPAGAALLDSALLRYGGEQARERLPLRPARLLAPLDALAGAAAALGHVSAQRGLDGAVRYDLPALPFEGEVYPSLALRSAALAAGVDWRQAQVQFGEAVQLGRLRLPLDALSRQWLNYYGPAGTFETLSFIDLLDGRIAPERLRGRLVLIGVTALGAGDHFPSPFDASLPGVERLATAIDNILSGRSLQRPAWAAPAELAAMLLLPLLAALLIARWPARWALPALAGVALALVGLLQALFVQQQLFVAPAFPALALLLGSL
ncbi:MAG: CHASE2 domain-containing protein, partial [Burkholderiaceae bacterium]